MRLSSGRFAGSSSGTKCATPARAVGVPRLHGSSSRSSTTSTTSSTHHHRHTTAPQHARAGRVTWVAAASMTGSNHPHHHPAMPAVVTPEWLQANLADVKLLDTSWYLAPMGRDAAAEFAAARIPGAQFWDVDGVADPASNLPHMLPSAAAFGAAADALGISHDDALVLYDGLGLFGAARAWWTWRVFGHERVAVLEGGLPAWRAAGGAVDEAPPADADALTRATQAARSASSSSASAGGKYKAALMADKVRSMLEMRSLVAPAAAALAAGQPAPALAQQVVDARPAGRFAGRDPEPRAGLLPGHMPGAASVPFTEVYVGGGLQGARLRPVDELQGVFEAAGVDVQAPVVCTCGSGLTACVLALALHQVTGALAAVYDGSWCEWGDPAHAPDNPIVSDGGEA